MYLHSTVKQRNLILSEFYDREYSVFKKSDPLKAEHVLAMDAGKRQAVTGTMKGPLLAFINKINQA